ncbi:hypothetical protein RE476_06175 [Methanolobus mangrovi]|uniref:Uncharacterized protein n=1 Tax=Methanolobus mangrovi TaxID=3072977 RepID=A0AA51YHQ7_9EURY|nr:hypothetical protein [Methanolobus mangrovi]WMW23402.1 hypothetical protein RE476_06175 [Methanolobus mangrovi]
MDINGDNVNDEMDTRIPMIFSIVAGSLYFLLGLLQLSAGFTKILIGPEVQVPLTGLLFVPADIIGSFVLLLIGTVFIYGVMEMRSGIPEGISYAYVGILIALIFAVIYMLVSTGNMLEAYLLKNEEFIGWTPASDLRPGIYLAVLPLFALIKWQNMFKPPQEKGLLK